MIKRLLPIAAATLLLTACGAPESTPAPESTSVTTSASSTSSTTSTTSSAAPTTSAEPTPTIEPAPEQPSPDSEYPAQSMMIQHGANAERINVFEDTAGQFWLCDKMYPNGSPESDFYAAPNGCAGPYGSANEAQEGLARAMRLLRNLILTQTSMTTSPPQLLSLRVQMKSHKALPIQWDASLQYSTRKSRATNTWTVSKTQK